MPMNCSARVLALGQIGDRQGRGVGGENAILGDHGFDLFGHLGFDGWVFKDGFDDQVTAFERIKIRRGCDAASISSFFSGVAFLRAMPLSI